MASEPPCDADFTPEEWVALFPAAGQPFLALGREEGEAASDRGAEFRNANPVTLAAMLAAFTNPALLLAASLAAGEPWAWATTGWRTVARSVLWVASALAIQGASAALSEGSFGARQIGVAMASLGLLAACGNLVVGMAAMAHPTLPRALDFAAPAGLCRWLQLTASEGAREIGAKGSRLVEHGPGDHLCPCRDCQRNVQSLAAFLVALDISHYSLILASSSVCLVWTAIVTFREAFWSTWWCCLLAAVWALITFVLTVVPGTFSRFLFHRNVAYDKLATRLHHRATTLAMRSLLDSLLGTTNGETRSDPDGHANADALSRKGAQWLYVHLHRRFADFCRGQSIQDNSIFNASILLIQLPATIVAIIANVVAGSCIPLWLLLWLLLYLLIVVLGAVNLASRNDLISTVSLVYTDAQRALRTASLGLPPGAPLPAELERHDRVIASFRDLDGYRARMLGFPVTYGGVRTVLATLVTLGVAMWSVLRGLGVFLTVESFCPVS